MEPRAPMLLILKEAEQSKSKFDWIQLVLDCVKPEGMVLHPLYVARQMLFEGIWSF
jgi:hypothetical protein